MQPTMRDMNFDSSDTPTRLSARAKAIYGFLVLAGVLMIADMFQLLGPNHPF
jgi:hypothetical protein